MNKNLAGGYYIVSLGDVDLLGESVSLAGVAKLLYEAKKHKFVVLQDIVMDGEKKTAIPVAFEATMALTTEPEDWDETEDGEFVAEEVYTATIYNVYGKNIAIDAEGVASVTNFEVSADPTTLYGKFVRVISLQEWDALTHDEREALSNEGIFINGTIGIYKNPILLPSMGNFNHGMFIASTDTGAVMGLYILNNHSEHDLDMPAYGQPALVLGYNRGVQLLNGISLEGKNYPSYPADQTDKTYVLKLVNGTLTWVEEVAQ